MSVEIEIDLSEYNVKIEPLPEKLRNLLPTFVREDTNIVKEELERAVPVKTGRLKNSIGQEVSDDHGRVFTSSGYGKFVDEGYGPHIIRGNPYLRFEIDGQEFFRRQIFHPGYAGAHFREAALISSEPRIRDSHQRILESLS